MATYAEMKKALAACYSAAEAYEENKDSIRAKTQQRNAMQALKTSLEVQAGDTRTLKQLKHCLNILLEPFWKESSSSRSFMLKSLRTLASVEDEGSAINILQAEILPKLLTGPNPGLYASVKEAQEFLTAKGSLRPPVTHAGKAEDSPAFPSATQRPVVAPVAAPTVAEASARVTEHAYSMARRRIEEALGGAPSSPKPALPSRRESLSPIAALVTGSAKVSPAGTPSRRTPKPLPPGPKLDIAPPWPEETTSPVAASAPAPGAVAQSPAAGASPSGDTPLEQILKKLGSVFGQGLVSGQLPESRRTRLQAVCVALETGSLATVARELGSLSPVRRSRVATGPVAVAAPGQPEQARSPLPPSAPPPPPPPPLVSAAPAPKAPPAPSAPTPTSMQRTASVLRATGTPTSRRERSLAAQQPSQADMLRRGLQQRRGSLTGKAAFGQGSGSEASSESSLDV